MPDPPFERDAAHKWFAIELNNISWELLEKTDRTPEEDEDLIHGAHASCFHWKKTGNLVNHSRALCLVANAHSAIGQGTVGLHFADRCVAMIEADREQFSDWDLPFAVDGQARALAAVGETVSAEEKRQAARQLGDAIAGEEDKKVFDEWFSNWG